MHALEKEMATHASILAWRIPGTEEPGGLPSMGSHRVGHDGSNLAAAAVTEFDKQFLHAQYCVDSYKRHRRNMWSRHFPQEASNRDKETKRTHFLQKTHETRSSGYKMSPSTGYQTCNGALSLPSGVIHGKSCNLSKPVSSIWERFYLARWLGGPKTLSSQKQGTIWPRLQTGARAWVEHLQSGEE